MILLWFILGIALIFGIARYNESNKLFWTLMIAYAMGFMGTKMVLETVSSEKQSNVNSTQIYSMQAPAASFGTLTCLVTDEMPKTSTVVTAQKPAGQSVVSAFNNVDITLSEVFGGIRDQPPQTLLKPPECDIGIFNTS